MGNTLIKSSGNKSSKSNQDSLFRTDHLNTDLKRRSVRGGMITIVQQIAKMALQIGSTIVLARLLTPEDYGLVGMVKAVTGFIELFKHLGLNTATIQKAEINHSQVSTLFWINIGVSVFLAGLTALLAPLIASFYNEPRLIPIMIVLAFGYIFSGIGTQHYALVSRQMRYRTLAINDMSSLVIGIIVAIIAAWFGAQYWALILMNLTIALISSIGIWLVSGWRPGLPHWNSEIKTMLAFGGGLTGSNIVSYLSSNIDNILIGKYWGAEELGLYTRAYQLLVLPLFSINGTIRNVAINTLSRLVDSPQRFRTVYLRILEKVIMLAMPLVALLLITSDWLVLIVLGPQWSDVSNIFRWFSFSALIQPVNYTMGWLLISQGRTWEMFRFWTLTNTISVIAIIVGLPWKSSGVAAAYSLAGLCLKTPLLYWYVGKHSPVRTSDFYRTMIPSLCAAFCTILTLLAFRQWVEISNPFIGLTISFTITIATALTVFAIFPSGRLALEDWKNLVSLISSKKKSS